MEKLEFSSFGLLGILLSALGARVLRGTWPLLHSTHTIDFSIVTICTVLPLPLSKIRKQFIKNFYSYLFPLLLCSV